MTSPHTSSLRILDPTTVHRLTVADDALAAMLPQFLAMMGTRLTDAHQTPVTDPVAHGLGYPWQPREPQLRAAIPTGGERFSVIAIGANASAARLSRIASMSDGVPGIETAWLTDFDIVASGVPTSYGAFAAVLAPSPGTRVRVGVLDATHAQFEAMALREFGYRPGLLDGIELVGHTGRTWRRAYLFAGRFGMFDAGGVPFALSAIEGAERRFPVATQREVFLHAARRLFGPGADAEDLLHVIHRHPHTLVRLVQWFAARALPNPQLPGWVALSAAPNVTG